MITYLLKVFACGTIFYGLYHVFLSKEKTLVFNRFYLLGGLIASYLIPLITITKLIEAPQQNNYAAYMPLKVIKPIIVETSIRDYLIYACCFILLVVSAFLLIRFTKNLINISRKISLSRQLFYSGATLALSENTAVPYSFLNTIFLNEAEYEQGKIEPEVLIHELAHVNQKHSYDILFIEILQIVSWFNPIIYLYKSSIKMNHELLADAAVVKKFNDVHSYQQILMQRATSPFFDIALSSKFNYLTTKKRLIMLKKPFVKNRVFIASLAIIPTLALALFAGSNQQEREKASPVSSEKNRAVSINADSVPPPPLRQSPPISPPPPPKLDVTLVPPPPAPKERGKKLPPSTIVVEKFGPGATQADLEKYESIVSKIRVGENQYRGRLSNVDYTAMFGIYDKMSKNQRQTSSKLPPPPPPTVTIEKFGPGATQIEMEQYESLAKKVRTMINDSVKVDLANDELTFISKTYSKMNKEQRASTKLLPPPPPPPAEPYKK